MKKLLLIVLLSSLTIAGIAQVSGSVFRDYNNNGTRENSPGVFQEPLVAGAIINAFDANDALVASYTSNNGTGYPYAAPNYTIPAIAAAFNGVQGSNTGFVPAGTPVRLEFVIPAAGSRLLNSSVDFSAKSGGSSVQFAAGGVSNINYGLHNPAEYMPSVNPALVVAAYSNGNPLGGGTAGTAAWFWQFNYNSSGLTAPSNTLNGTTIGSVWGVAYSRQAKRIFTSAFLKRHAGLGTLGSGGIYMIDPRQFYCYCIL